MRKNSPLEQAAACGSILAGQSLIDDFNALRETHPTSIIGEPNVPHIRFRRGVAPWA
jgi:hypothetical protein